MKKQYTSEKTVLVLVALLKKHGIKKIVVSPGTTNIPFVGSVQNDSFFELYSCVDERSAAYMACGLAFESGEPVCLSCTGATASRNYMSGLTEAFYRKLPVIAITCSQFSSRIAHLIPQVTDRSTPPSDVAKISVELPYIKDDEDFWECEVNANKALLECRRNGGGPVHINLITNFCSDFNTKVLPEVRKISRYTFTDQLPEIIGETVAILVGSHRKMSERLTKAIDTFCQNNNAAVWCDHTSNYNGKYRIDYEIVVVQAQRQLITPDIMIYIGEMTGAYHISNIAKEMWRVSQDGELRDPYKNLKNIFQMDEVSFFESYSERKNNKSVNNYYLVLKKQVEDIRANMPKIPFSNIWIASQLQSKFTENCVLHISIMNSLRSWNFFDKTSCDYEMCNVGGYGIDGPISTLIGASLANKDRIHFVYTGDLAFFYDLNSFGNRYIGSNIRVMLINNGVGMEFKNYTSIGSQFGEDTGKYIAASGHFGNKSKTLVKSIAENLGFEYMSASNKKEFSMKIGRFISDKLLEKPIIFEAFIDDSDENDALYKMMNLGTDVSHEMKNNIKGTIKSAIVGVAGQSGLDFVRTLVKNEKK